MPRYPRAHPSIPSLRAGVKEKATIGAIRRTTTTFDLPATFDLFDSSLPYLAPHSPPVNRSSAETAQLSRADSGKERRYGRDFQQAGLLAQKNVSDDAPTDRRRDSFLPSIHTRDEDHMGESTTRTLSSSSLYTSEFDFEFPQPPLSPDLGAYKDCPMFTKEETCQVKKILRKRWGAIDVVEPSPPVAAAAVKTRTPSSSVPCSLPVSMDGEESLTNRSWTKCWDGRAFGDFSWEAYDGSDNTDDKENEGTYDILGKMGLSDSIKDSVSSGRADRVTPVLGLPDSVLNVRQPVKEDLDDVSVVLTALRSSMLLDYLAEQDKCTDDDVDRDQALCEEMRMRMGSKKYPPAVQIPPVQEDPIIPISSPAILARCLQPKSLSSSSSVLPSIKRPARKSFPTLRTPKPSGDFGEARIASPYIPGAKQMTEPHSSRTSAFERLESSISKLQMHSPHLPQQSRSYAPPVPPKDNVGIYSRNICRRSGVAKKPSMISPPMGRFAPELQVNSSTPIVHAGSRNNCGNKHFHVRSPSAPASVMNVAMKAPLALAFSVHEKRPDVLHNDLLRRNILPSLSADKVNAEGFRSFMDMTPEQKPRNTHTRSRSSMVSAAFHAEKARKLLARASSSIASWGKGLGWTSSKKG